MTVPNIVITILAFIGALVVMGSLFDFIAFMVLLWKDGR